jgi:hypothetical protein
MAMMAMTTSSSISVNALDRFIISSYEIISPLARKNRQKTTALPRDGSLKVCRLAKLPALGLSRFFALG